MTRYPAVLRMALVLALAQQLHAVIADNDQQDGFMTQFSSVGFLSSLFRFSDFVSACFY
jgi:hypothetical protein